MPLLLAIAVFLAAVATHCLLSFRRPTGTVRRFFVTGFAFGLVWLGWTAMAGEFSLAPTLLYAFLFELYLFLFTLASNSVSLAIVVRLLDAPQPLSDLANGYSADAMIQRRLNQLTSSGLVQQTAAGLEITTQGKRLVRFFGLLRAVFRQVPYEY